MTFIVCPVNIYTRGIGIIMYKEDSLDDADLDAMLPLNTHYCNLDQRLTELYKHCNIILVAV